MNVGVPVWLVALAILLIVAQSVILWSIKRRKRPHIRIPESQDPTALMKSIAGFTQGTAVEGNAVRLFHNGSFWDALFADFEAARHSISLETFLAKPGKLCDRLAGTLAKKARQGVEVRVILDGSGGRKFDKNCLREMREAGCRVHMYHPLKLRNLGLINNRTHRKIAVVDGSVGYVGGHCLVDTWLGNAEDKKHFRDISARIEGPVVAQLQSAFSDNWIEETGEVPAGNRVFPHLEKAGDVEAHIVYVSPTGSPSTIKLLHYAAIQVAQKRLWIQNPYFLPDPDAREMLAGCAKRGVDVRIMIPAASSSDSPVVQHASHHHYGTLLEAGVRIWEYGRTLLHQKVFVVDGAFASIGSSNFDDRSFEINDEVSLVAYDANLARELEETFERDLVHCEEQHYEAWQNRSLWHKLIDGTTFLFNEQL